MAEWCFRILKGAVFVYPIAVVFIKCFGGIYRVDGCSMQPCLNPGTNSLDWVYTKDTEIWPVSISYGDVVTFPDPRNPEVLMIKRIIGLEGDSIIKTRGPGKELVTIPKGHCWVEGDHTNSSKDSNMFGPVPMALIKSKALYVVWPPSRWQRIPTDIPPGRSAIRNCIW